MIVIQKPGDTAYVLKCPERGGFLTWDHEDKRYLLMFTSGDKAEEYSERVLEHMQAEVGVVRKEDSEEFIASIVANGIHWAIWDYPPTNDQFAYWEATLEENRNYGVVYLKGLVDYRKKGKKEENKFKLILDNDLIY
jgi:hypothetical protein